MALIQDGVGEHVERENYRLCLEAAASKQGTRREENGCKSPVVPMRMPDVFKSGDMNNHTTRGYGCDAARIDDLEAIKKAAVEAWRKSKPTVLEIPISPQVPPLI
jgi:hypothetical protein